MILRKIILITIKGILFFSFSSIYSQAYRIVDLDVDSTHQIIRGFGAANILQWRPDMTESEIETAFGTDDGQLGFTILRLRIQPDKNQWSTNLPSAKKAIEMGAIVFASPWNPPSDMLDPQSSERRILPERYADYAAHLDSFNTYMKENGVDLYAISVQNEPDYGEWTRWTPEEMLTFMRENAGDIHNRVIAPESFQFLKNMSDPILNDSLACSNVDIIGGHIYGGGKTAYPLAEQKGKEVWMTEHYTESSNSGNLWPLAYDVAFDIHGVMSSGMSAYVWWYIVRYYGPISDGENNTGSKGSVTKRGYIMSQFARFIRPGYKRIYAFKVPQRNVYLTAYKDSASSKVVVVALNNGSSETTQEFQLISANASKFISYITTETKNCERGVDYEVTDGYVEVTLEPKSITTFISEDFTVAVEDENSSLPAGYSLNQNYPNPFNPTTNISFTLPKSSNVKLVVVNILGKEVMTLANGVYSQGYHNIQFDASSLASGMYLYRIEAGNYITTKKMVLLK